MRVLAIYCGTVQRIVVLEITLCCSCGQALEVVIHAFEIISFILGIELWEEHFESLVDLVKEYILDVWVERKCRLYGENACTQHPSPQSPTGDLGDIAWFKVRNCKGLCQGGKPGTGKLYTDVALPTLVGAWSMALVLRRSIEYYYYQTLTLQSKKQPTVLGLFLPLTCDMSVLHIMVQPQQHFTYY